MPRILLMAALLMLSNAPHADDRSLHDELARIAGERIYFAHQSVGGNILEGLQELSAAAGVPVRIMEAPSASKLGGPGVGHIFVAENGDPLLKLRNFKSALGAGSHADLALIKFCYVDIDAATDPRALFEQYRKTIDELRAANPRTTLVHVTLPLTTVQTGPKAWIKRALGRAPNGTVGNVKREEYNTLLRRAYSGREPIFDLARVESIDADGTQAKVDWNGAVAPAMVPAYTDDGGHLNRSGRLRAARELVRVLAAARAPLQKFEDSATPVRMP
ncbi:MAG TPA: SGNH/GDSL hydrolase family protein [Burkholderiales bacterium]|nr:SGNH/GDSL hydrolase family protein [Burkholderiales bacterium]